MITSSISTGTLEDTMCMGTRMLAGQNQWRKKVKTQYGEVRGGADQDTSWKDLYRLG